MLIAGGFLSTMLPATGPAVAQLPATSQIERVPVCALEVSVPAGTLVLREKVASWGLARPEPASLALQRMLVSLACQRASGPPQLTTGGLVSRTVTCVCAVALKP